MAEFPHKPISDIDYLKRVVGYIQDDIKIIKEKIEGLEKRVPVQQYGSGFPNVGNFQPNYDDVVKELKLDSKFPLAWETGQKDIRPYSKELAERIALRIKWENIAKYVNGEWKYIQSDGNCIGYYFETAWKGDHWDYQVSTKQFGITQGTTYFKSAEAAATALKIMGKSDFEKMNS